LEMVISPLVADRAGVGAVDAECAAAHELGEVAVGLEITGRCNEAGDVDPGRGAEHDAVRVENHDVARRAEQAVDHAGGRGSRDAVRGNRRGARCLAETDRAVATDIEAAPVKDRARRTLRHGELLDSADASGRSTHAPGSGSQNSAGRQRVGRQRLRSGQVGERRGNGQKDDFRFHMYLIPSAERIEQGGNALPFARPRSYPVVRF
jgi:hypothetical protein